jgi:hypothetical protein
MMYYCRVCKSQDCPGCDEPEQEEKEPDTIEPTQEEKDADIDDYNHKHGTDL